MKEYKIGWQKYEDYLEKQLTSPLLDILSEAMMSKMETEEIEEDDEISAYEDEVEKENTHMSTMIPMSPKLMDDISMLSSYDCWLGHTNFDITNEVKDKLDATSGIEVLKICSRYRFFIGIGKMFDFTEVRQFIEESIIPEGE